ncbi:MAG TPA: dipeptidyl carboxypeptidase II, partial [Sphingomonas sp.]|nr:dipeptidyl carboxypeptidase II [Sphingomonas sp.]
MNRTACFGTVAALALATAAMAAAPSSAPTSKRANPFETESTLPFHAPRFDLIKDSDYLPAFEEGMARHLAEIRKIADNPAAPTFGNTIVAMEKSGRMLDRVSEAFFGVVQANTNDRLDKVQSEIAPKLSQHQDAIYLNSRLFQRVKTLHDKQASLNLTPEQAQLLKVYY